MANSGPAMAGPSPTALAKDGGEEAVLLSCRLHCDPLRN